MTVPASTLPTDAAIATAAPAQRHWVHAAPGSGRWLVRTGGPAATPTGRLVADIDPQYDFGAALLD